MFATKFQFFFLKIIEIFPVSSLSGLEYLFYINRELLLFERYGGNM